MVDINQGKNQKWDSPTFRTKPDYVTHTIKFNIKTPPTADDKNSLFLDYQGQKIQNFIINGKKLDALDNTQYEKNTRIVLPKSNLK